MLILSRNAVGETPPQIDLVDSGSNQQKPEVQIPDWRLRIICPKCGAVLYICDAGEIFSAESPEIAHCHPVDKKIPELKMGNHPQCPFDGTLPYTNSPCPLSVSPGGMCTMFYTNKGWLPKRYRPHWQE